MKKDSPLSNLIYILIAGMGNVKHGKWSGILIYFTAISLLGMGLYFAEQEIIELYYHPSQTLKTFLILIYLAFAFFWDGTRLIGSGNNNHVFRQDDGKLNKDSPHQARN